MKNLKSFPKVSRRRMLNSLAALTLLSATGRVEAASRKQVTFVLVHGAWHGGWMWKNLSPLLRAGGHEVYAPTMTGMAERAHELTADVDLNRHVQDIVEFLFYQDLRDVVLVGHSYGGTVITGVAEKAPERLSHLIYLDAFLPENGKAQKEYAPVPATRADGWRIPPFPLTFFDGQIGAWAEARFTDQPIKTFTQPLQISPDRTRALAKTYILTSPGSGWFTDAAARAKRAGWTTRSFIWEHEAVLEQAAPVAKIILEVI